MLGVAGLKNCKNGIAVETRFITTEHTVISIKQIYTVE
jgi:hypothetical protein